MRGERLKLRPAGAKDQVSYWYLYTMKATQQDIDNLSFDENEHPSIIYAYDYQRYTTCMQLLTFGMMIFNDAYIVKDIDSLTAKRLVTNTQTADKYDILLRNELIDSIRICTCFENIFKGLLLYNGYVIHELSDQNNINSKIVPVKLSDALKADQKLEKLYKVRNGILSATDTLKLSVLLNDEYLKVLKPLLIKSMSDSMVDSSKNSTLKYTEDGIKKMVEQNVEAVIQLVESKRQFRNKLHFYSKMEFQISEEDFFLIRKAKEYISTLSHYIDMWEDEREK